MSTQSYPNPQLRQHSEIPPELRHLDQWLAYRAVKKPNGKINKPPLDAKTGGAGSSTDPTTWSSFEAAVARSPLGAAFVLTPDDPYFAVDLDNCVDDETGVIAPWAHAIVERLPIYWETSYSGKGLRGIGRGVLPGDRCHTGDIRVCETKRGGSLTTHSICTHRIEPLITLFGAIW